MENGIFGSVDANRGDPQNGWDTAQVPNSVDELSLALYEILRHGGLQRWIQLRHETAPGRARIAPTCSTVTYREICLRPAEAVADLLAGREPDPRWVFGAARPAG